MKTWKVCTAVLIAFFCTAVILTDMWCTYTPAGQEWYQEWKAPEHPSSASAEQ